MLEQYCQMIDVGRALEREIKDALLKFESKEYKDMWEFLQERQLILESLAGNEGTA